MLKKINDLTELTAMFIVNLYNAKNTKQRRRAVRYYREDVCDIINDVPELKEEVTLASIASRKIVDKQMMKQYTTMYNAL